MALAGQMNAVQYRFIKLLGQFDENGGWQGDGIHSFAHWLNWKIGMGMMMGREKVHQRQTTAGRRCAGHQGTGNHPGRKQEKERGRPDENSPDKGIEVKVDSNNVSAETFLKTRRSQNGKVIRWTSIRHCSACISWSNFQVKLAPQ